MNLKPYETLTLAERVQAVQDARREGHEAAIADLGQGGTLEELGTEQVFFMRVIDWAYQSDEITDQELADWKTGLDDPRTHAWLAGWNEAKLERETESALEERMS